MHSRVTTRRRTAVAVGLAALTSLALVVPAHSASAASVAAVPSAKACCGNQMTTYKQVVPVDGSTYTNEAVGQVRVSNGIMQNGQGVQVGTFSASHTILSINTATGMRKVQNNCTMTFGNGSVMTSGIDYWPVGSAPASGTENTVAIVGGTGFYAGATGVSRQVLLTNGFYKTTFTFKNS